MGGPMSNEMLGKMLHRQYEAEASRYWGWRGRRKREASVAERVKPALEWARAGLSRAWCATASLGLSPAGCSSVG
jgi:hypothetical protein